MHMTSPSASFSATTEEQFRSLLPARDSLDELQRIQYDHMITMFLRSQPYAWTGGHHGVTKDHWFRGEHYLKDRNKAGTYCTGVALEHWFLTYLSWFEDNAENEYGLTYAQMQEMKAYFFVHSDPTSKYDSGCGAGIAYFQKALEERLAQIKEQTGEEQGSVEDVYALSMSYHKDLSQARFGDYIQMQHKEDIHEEGGGHCGVFVGLEKPYYNGRYVDAVRLFQASSKPAYGQSGVSISWYMIDKTTEGFLRKFHIGSMRGL